MYGYREVKAAQVAAWFALKAGGRINVLKLAKLMYLAERESMAAYDEPMFYDRLVSMDHGPVTSISLNCINGLTESEVWPRYIGGRAGYDILCAEGVGPEDLDHLSRADLRILDDLWHRFGHLHQFDLRDWTHANCPEWENPHGSSTPIPHGRVFKFLDKPNAEYLAEAVLQHRLTDRAWSGPA